jgi:hypothetical protein
MPIIDAPFSPEYKQNKTLTSHNSNIWLSPLPEHRETPITYDLSFHFSGYPPGSSPNLVGSTQIYLKVTALSFGNATDFPFYLTKGQVIYTASPSLIIQITSDVVIGVLNVPTLVNCQALSQTVTPSTQIFTKYSLLPLKGSTSINANIDEQAIETTSLEQINFIKQHLTSRSLSFSLDFTLLKNDLAYHQILLRSRKYFEPVWCLITQSSPKNKGFWAYGVFSFNDPTIDISIKTALQGSATFTPYNNYVCAGSAIEQISESDRDNYLDTFKFASLPSQESLASTNARLILSNDTTSADQRTLNLSVVWFNNVASSISWSASPAIGHFTTTSVTQATYVIDRPIGENTNITFTALINGTITVSFIYTAIEFRDLFLTAFSNNQWLDSTPYTTSSTIDDNFVIFINKGSGNLTLQIDALDYNAITDQISIFDGSYGLDDNSNRVAYPTVSGWSGGTFNLTTPKATILYKTTGSSGLASKFRFNMS